MEDKSEAPKPCVCSHVVLLSPKSGKRLWVEFFLHFLLCNFFDFYETWRFWWLFFSFCLHQEKSRDALLSNITTPRPSFHEIYPLILQRPYDRMSGTHSVSLIPPIILCLNLEAESNSSPRKGLLVWSLAEASSYGNYIFLMNEWVSHSHSLLAFLMT